MMTMKTTLLSAFMVGFTTADQTCTMPTYLGSFKHKNAAFLDTCPNANGGMDLFISAFSGMPFSKGSISRVSSMNLQLFGDISTVKATEFDPKVTWPNGVKQLPSEVFIAGATSSERVVACGGFLVPTHGNGACTVYDVADDGTVSKFELARAGRGLFFHHAAWYDVDGDGIHDMVVAKASKSFFGSSTTGALYWYKNPGMENLQGARWEEHLLFDGPDVIFELHDLDGDSVPEIIATEFFNEKLTISWLKDDGVFGGGPDNWVKRTVADEMGRLFNFTMVDVNGDGKDEIVLTNHVEDADLAGVYAIEFPANGDFKTGNFSKHLMSNGYETLNGGPGQASPGGLVEIPMKNSDAKIFALSGDGNQKAYILCKGEGEFEYTKVELLDTGNTVGAIAVADVNGDGNAEIFVPSFEQGEIHVYTYGSGF